MFENTIAVKRAKKKNKLLEELENAKKDNKEWKIKQLEGKLAMFENKYYPSKLWDSSIKGSYYKTKEEK